MSTLILLLFKDWYGLCCFSLSTCLVFFPLDNPATHQRSTPGDRICSFLDQTHTHTHTPTGLDGLMISIYCCNRRPPPPPHLDLWEICTLYTDNYWSVSLRTFNFVLFPKLVYSYALMIKLFLIKILLYAQPLHKDTKKMWRLTFV